jgi:hypothetical protein
VIGFQTGISGPCRSPRCISCAAAASVTALGDKDSQEEPALTPGAIWCLRSNAYGFTRLSVVDLLGKDVAVAGVTRELLDHEQVNPSEANHAGARVSHSVIQVVPSGDGAGSAAGTLELCDNIAQGLVVSDCEAAVTARCAAVACCFGESGQGALKPDPFRYGRVLDQPNRRCRRPFPLLAWPATRWSAWPCTWIAVSRADLVPVRGARRQAPRAVIERAGCSAERRLARALIATAGPLVKKL